MCPLLIAVIVCFSNGVLVEVPCMCMEAPKTNSVLHDAAHYKFLHKWQMDAGADLPQDGMCMQT